MHHLFIHGNTKSSRKPVIPLERRLRAQFLGSRLRKQIKIRCSCTGLDQFFDLEQNAGNDFAGPSHFFDFFTRLQMNHNTPLSGFFQYFF